MGSPTSLAELALVVGLTDHPDRHCFEAGSPEDWKVYGPFHSEAAALRWERMMASLPGYRGAGSDRGWRFGFTHSALRGRSRPAAAG